MVVAVSQYVGVSLSSKAVYVCMCPKREPTWVGVGLVSLVGATLAEARAGPGAS